MAEGGERACLSVILFRGAWKGGPALRLEWEPTFVSSLPCPRSLLLVFDRGKMLAIFEWLIFLLKHCMYVTPVYSFLCYKNCIGNFQVLQRNRPPPVHLTDRDPTHNSEKAAQLSLAVAPK